MALRRTTRADWAARVGRVEQLIAQRLDDETLEPAHLAKAANLALHHFHRVFRAQTGETVMQHVRRLRLERAARTLRTPQAPERLLEVALEAGYESHEAFTRAFQARFGVAPSTWRETPRVMETTAPLAQISVRADGPTRLLTLRHRGSYARVGETWERLMTWAHARGLGGAAMVGLCPDDADVTPEALLRYDAGVEVGADVAAEGELVEQVVPAAHWAVGLHIGSYTRLHETYLDVIGRWFPESGYDLSPEAAVVERFLDDPRLVPEARLRTEVCVRIADVT
ncbi:MAG: AraC family transcriptional regulator [Archangiaceae bacterium]|nr:AraC family transcriptional regulator [Archangiaceae bacterium]